MAFEKNPINPKAERQKAELRQAGGQAMIPLAPQGQSLADEKAAELEAQAAELRAQGGQAAIPLAEGLSQPVDRAPAVAEVPPTPEKSVVPQPSGLMQEAAVLEKQGKESAALLDKQQAELQVKEAEAEVQRQKVQQEIDSKIKEIDSIKIEPKSFYAGKSTGEKISAGIAHFFAALTPQGAQAAISIIDNAIQRDMDAQKANLAKKQSTLGDLEKKLGSIGAAESAFRLKSLQNIELQLKSASEKAKGPLARAKAVQAMEAVQANKEAAQQKLAVELAKIQAKTGAEKKLSGEEMKRLDAARDAYRSVSEMKSALAKGVNTFSLVGDNDFTIAQRIFAENLGRMQSGGAISADEAERFMAMAPTYTDSKEIQQKKLAKLEQMMGDRLKSLGKDPTEETTGLKGLNFRAK